jgi:hypothetical protein
MRSSEGKKWKLKPQSVSLRGTNVTLSVHKTNITNGHTDTRLKEFRSFKGQFNKERGTGYQNRNKGGWRRPGG